MEYNEHKLLSEFDPTPSNILIMLGVGFNAHSDLRSLSLRKSRAY